MGTTPYIFFDDFERTDGTLTKWTRHKIVGVYPRIEGDSYLRCGGGVISAPYGHTVLGSSATYAGFLNNAVEYRYRVSSNAISELSVRGNFAANTGYKVRSDQRTGEGQSVLKPPYTAWAFIPGSLADGVVPAANVWYRGTTTVYGTGTDFLKLYRDGILRRTTTDSQYTSAGQISLQNHYGSYSDYDWAAVRKFAGSELTRGNWTVEFTVPVELTSFTAVPHAQNYIVLHWVTQSETDVMGFYIYRNTINDIGTAFRVSPLITATNTSSQTSYQYEDNEVTPGMWYYWLQNIDFNGNDAFHGPVLCTLTDGNNGGSVPDLPLFSGIEAIYPNPFNPSAMISYNVSSPSAVNVHIYNSRGQLVRTYNEGNKDRGRFSVVWNGVDASGSDCPTGIYLIRLTVGKNVFSRKAAMVK